MIEIDRRFRDAYCLHHQGDLMIETVSTSETSANFYQTTWLNIPEDNRIHTSCRENLKSHLFMSHLNFAAMFAHTLASFVISACPH
jgi:hypothetical protein